MYLSKSYIATMSVLSPTNGHPHMTPVWTVLHNNKFYTSTKEDSAKARFIDAGEQKAGITIIAPEGFPYLSATGTARLRTKQEFDSFPEIVKLLTHKYREDEEDAEETYQSIMNAGDRVLIEITPNNIFGSV